MAQKILPLSSTVTPLPLYVNGNQVTVYYTQDNNNFYLFPAVLLVRAELTVGDKKVRCCVVEKKTYLTFVKQTLSAKKSFLPADNTLPAELTLKVKNFDLDSKTNKEVIDKFVLALKLDDRRRVQRVTVTNWQFTIATEQYSDIVSRSLTFVSNCPVRSVTIPLDSSAQKKLQNVLCRDILVYFGGTYVAEVPEDAFKAKCDFISTKAERILTELSTTPFGSSSHVIPIISGVNDKSAVLSFLQSHFKNQVLHNSSFTSEQRQLTEAMLQEVFNNLSRDVDFTIPQTSTPLLTLVFDNKVKVSSAVGDLAVLLKYLDTEGDDKILKALEIACERRSSIQIASKVSLEPIATSTSTDFKQQAKSILDTLRQKSVLYDLALGQCKSVAALNVRRSLEALSNRSLRDLINYGNFKQLTWKTSYDAMGLVTEMVQDVSSFPPIGTVVGFPGPAGIPDNWLVCDGSALNSSVLEDLYYAIGQLYGNGGGVPECDFNLPDFRGVFLRGLNGDRDPPLDDPERNFNNYQADTVVQHNHAITVTCNQNLFWSSPLASSPMPGGLEKGPYFSDSGTSGVSRGSNTFNPSNTANYGTTETRPRNYPVIWIMRAI